MSCDGGRRLAVGLLVMTGAACGGLERTLDAVAEDYVAVVLALGQHDPDYVDAYYGPPEWRSAAEADGRSTEQLGAAAQELLSRVEATDLPEDSMLALRRDYLRAQLRAVAARARMLSGERMAFDVESQALYDAVAPLHPAAHFDSLLADLDDRLPGAGTIADRYERFRADFIIPTDRLDTVFGAAIEACRERTEAHLDLPADESFVVEYVTDKTWSGYNWYQGGYRSLIQVNTDLPIYIDRALDLACHEGYPGHHVYNTLLEHHLTRGRGWAEFSVYPLFSPQSLIAEGSANYGIDIAFPGSERVAFERDVLFPLAGLNPDRAGDYHAVQELVNRLDYAGNEAARRYLDGEIDRDQAAAWLNRYALMPPERARQRVGFIEQYRSYVINYNLGKDLVQRHVELSVRDDTDAERWRVFSELLSSPRLPSGLRRD